MQFMFHEDSNLYGYDKGNQDFEFPTNIKQMGCLDDEVKIYMEDYVYTYLYQYAKSNGNKEKIAVLVGKHIESEGQTMIIISGAIQGKHTIRENGIEMFSKETWEYVNDQMEVYFKSMSIVGWMHTQPGFGAFLMSRDEIFHREQFREPWQVLYALDPMERMDAFFVHNSERTGLRPAKGYFIYYSKNENMQDYMMDNSLMKPKATPEEKKQMESLEGNGELERGKRDPNQRIDAAKKIRKVLNQKAEEEAVTKQKYTILAGVSGVLCLACIMMGANLIQNQSRIARLESEVTTVKTSYHNIAEEMSNTQAVFAAQNKTEKTETEKPEQKEEKKQTEETEQSVQEPEKETDKPIQPESETPVQPVEQPEPVQPEIPTQPEPVQPEIPVQPETTTQTPSANQQAEKIRASRVIPDFYIVEEGDTLGYISYKFYDTGSMVSQIMAVNNMDNPDKIVVGNKIILP